MPFTPVYVHSYNCLSPAGEGLAALAKGLDEGLTFLREGLGSLPPSLDAALESLSREKALRDQDRATLMGVYLARTLSFLSPECGVIVGSSRGAASSIEASIQNFLEGKRLKPSTSPVTTASGLSSALARDRSLSGPSFSLSAACSTGLYAIIQAAASINAGLAKGFLVGGVEAANTPFTREMMASTKVLSESRDAFPCKPGADERSGMVLSEGAALLHISGERGESAAAIVGMGAATESGTLTGVSSEGSALQAAMRKAMDSAAIPAHAIDLIVGHGAGTVKGDQAERNAYATIFGTQIPPLVFHKWCGGHMLGASAALSVMLAIEHLLCGETPPHPYFAVDHPQYSKKRLASNRYALVTSMGFGGSACAVLVKNLIP